MQISNTKTGLLITLTALVATAAFATGCSKLREDASSALQQSKSGSSKAEGYPHAADWKSGHVQYMAGMNMSAITSGKITLATARLEKCAVCHDRRNNGHPINVSCAGSCHRTGDVASPAPVQPNKCAECHDKVDKKQGHYPAMAGLCEVCHTLTTGFEDHKNNSDRTKVVTKSSEVCMACHAPMDDGAFKHAALQVKSVETRSNEMGNDGVPVGQGCTNCHDPHRGKATGDHFLKDNTKALCLRCHGDYTKEVKKNDDGTTTPLYKIVKPGSHISAMDGEQSCLGCHRPHAGNVDKLLINKDPASCLGCHNKDIVVGSRTIKDIQSKINMQSAHDPAKTGCSDCHLASPHKKSSYSNILTANYSMKDRNTFSSGEKGPYALCFGCHFDLETAMTDPASADTKFRDVKKNGDKTQVINLHYVHVVAPEGDTAAGRACKICHNPHGSHQTHLVNEVWMMNGKYPVKIKYDATANGGTCTLSCHGEKSYSR